MNGLTLAYIGDALYELYIRKYLIDQGFTNVGILHKKAVKYTSGETQAKIVSYWLEANLLTEEEMSYFKRGRNHQVNKRKNLDAKTYNLATGFEAIIGGLYFKNENLAYNKIKEAIEYVEKEVK